MEIIDLTHVIEPGMPVYPGTEPPSFEPANTYENNGFKETKISMYTHTGTHMDPPAHLYEGRTTLDAFPPGQFIGKALVIDCRSLSEGEAITIDHLKKTMPAAYKEFARTEVLEYIIGGDYKGIGFDVIGLDPIADDNLTRHKRLFESKDIVNIENLCNLDLCGSELFWFSCFPLKISDCDGSPVRAVAWFE